LPVFHRATLRGHPVRLRRTGVLPNAPSAKSHLAGASSRIGRHPQAFAKIERTFNRLPGHLEQYPFARISNRTVLPGTHRHARRSLAHYSHRSFRQSHENTVQRPRFRHYAMDLHAPTA
jgi:hypothetical protein